MQAISASGIEGAFAERQQRPVALSQLDGRAVGAGSEVERKALELGQGQRGDLNTARPASAPKVMIR
jgi:hypothetical protein